MAKYAIQRMQKQNHAKTLREIRHLDRHEQCAIITRPELSDQNATIFAKEVQDSKGMRNYIKAAIKHHNEVVDKQNAALIEDNPFIDRRKLGKHFNEGKAAETVELLFSFSNEMEDQIDKREFIHCCRSFIKEQFPTVKFLRADIHADETTWHIHWTILPTTRDGRLSAKEVLGGPEQFRQYQTAFADKVQHFGLERGIPKQFTKLRHKTTWQHWNQLADEVERLRDEVARLNSDEYRQWVINDNIEKTAQAVIEDILER